MKRESPSAGYRTRQLYLGILRDRTRATFQTRLYQDQNRRSDQRSNTISASVAYVPQAPDGSVAQEDLGFHPASAYKYSGERGACKVGSCIISSGIGTPLIGRNGSETKTQNCFRSPRLFAELWC